MDVKHIQKGCAAVLAAYLILAALFWGIAGGQMRSREDGTTPVQPGSPVGEIVRGMELRQPFRADADEISGVSVMLSTYGRKNTSRLVVGIEDAAGNRIAEVGIPASDIADNQIRDITFDAPVAVTPGAWYALVLDSPDAEPGNAVTAWIGGTVASVHGGIPLWLTEQRKLRVNGAVWDGLLHYSIRARGNLWIGTVYWRLVLLAGVLIAIYSGYLMHAARRGKSTAVLRLVSAFQRYGYLLRQLVVRDFKTKYKRSILGVLWSFLNPLLTMLVQYIVFSTVFRSDIPNFPLYLLTGIVCFNFFSESTSMALLSILGNASLITKVYVPKYIYPISRVLSSAINLLFSLIPLLLVMVITRTPFRPAILLLPFGIFCLLAFCLGMGFILSASMVFFRDTQFLWGVISMFWMYATPIFYPENIIPEQYMLLYKCNPLYHIIRFIRILLMDGVSPEPKAYLFCLLASFSVLLAGVLIFKKNQDKFILNL